MPLPESPASLPSTAGLSWYAVPEAVKQWLAIASEHWDEPEVGDRYMDRALEQASDCPDVLVSAYRYFFYTHNYPRALQITDTVLATVSASHAMPAVWSERKLFLSQHREEPAIRLYINAYAASGLIRARLGEVDRAKQIAAQVSELENQNEFGGKVIHDILNASDEEE
ncbi:MAG: hypothetical protein HC838_07825 [Spirulinaceae cyanobacterium RM2_2_10]|nr:hypothetical protein [Spirulinaceae cyanobacterium SM2_1_0]NJO19979.1 hypothetical protein [Spirulinaceae cyanobacterium RM2_2_10]